MNSMIADIQTPDIQTSFPEPPTENLIKQSDLDLIDHQFSDGCRLNSDYTNAYSAQFTWLALCNTDLLFKDNLTPLKSYNEYFQEKNPATYEIIIARTDPTAIPQLDKLVKEYNESFPKMIETNDFQAAKERLDVINILVHSVYPEPRAGSV